MSAMFEGYGSSGPAYDEMFDGAALRPPYLALRESLQTLTTPELVRRQIALPDNPYFLRRQKEDLTDEHGRPLFVERHVGTQPFTLSVPELELYQQVTDYINRFLGGGAGARRHAVAADGAPAAARVQPRRHPQLAPESRGPAPVTAGRARAPAP